MELTKEREELVVKNIRLVYYCLHKKMRYYPNHPEYEEYLSEGMVGLIKAANSYDVSKKYAFATYATKCIMNEFLMYRRRTKKYEHDLSFNTEMYESDKKKIMLEDMLEDKRANFADSIIDEDLFSYLINITLNCFPLKEKCLILYRLSDMNQIAIAGKLNISQSYISRLERKCYSKLRDMYSKNASYEEGFKMTMTTLRYEITFSTKETKKFNALFATLLQRMSADLPDFNLSFSKERIVLQLMRDNAAFAFIAEIIQAMDEYNLNLTSDKNASTKTHSNIQQIDSNNTSKMNENSLDEEIEDYEAKDIEDLQDDECEMCADTEVTELQDTETVDDCDTVEMDTQQSVDIEECYSMEADELKTAESDITEADSQQKDVEESHTVEENNLQDAETTDENDVVENNIPQTEDAAENDISQNAEVSKTDSIDKSSEAKNGTSKIKQIIEYISTLNCFKVNELAKIFKKTDLANAVFIAKKKGLITSIGRGEYSVNKN